MEERSGDIAMHDNAASCDDAELQDLSKRQRTDEHPGISTIPVTANAPAAIANYQQHHHAVAVTANHHQDPSMNAAVMVVPVQNRGGGEGHKQQQLSPVNNDLSSSSSSSSSFHRISLSPPGTTLPPLPATTARAAAAAASSSSDSWERRKDDTMAPTSTTSTSACPSPFSDPSASAKRSISSSNSSIDSVSGLQDKAPAQASFDSRDDVVDVVCQQQAFATRRYYFRSKLVRAFKQCYMLVLVTALLGGVYTMQQQHAEMPPPGPPPSPAFWTSRWFTFLPKSSLSEQPAAAATALLLPRRDGSRPVTLRDFLSHHQGFSLAMAPAFFGFYGYFGALAAWEDGISTSLLRGAVGGNVNDHNEADDGRLLQHVSGASAGAMAAVLLAAGVAPKRAAEFCETITLSKFADFPGFGAVFRGYKFERIMHDFLSSEIQDQVLRQQAGMNTTTNATRTTTTTRGVVDSLLLLQNSRVPVAVTALDIETMQTKILTRGSMARAARASATFPLLFQPVGWVDDGDNNDHDEIDDDGTVVSCNVTDMNSNCKNQKLDATLIDGGIRDHAGVDGLKAFVMDDAVDQCNRRRRRLSSVPPPRRIVQLAVGGFLLDNPPGPGYISSTADQVVSISLMNLPMCGPWPSGLRNGPIAVQAAYRAMMAALDTPLEFRQALLKEGDNHDENNDKSLSVHYELQLDTTPFWKPS